MNNVVLCFILYVNFFIIVSNCFAQDFDPEPMKSMSAPTGQAASPAGWSFSSNPYPSTMSNNPPVASAQSFSNLYNGQQLSTEELYRIGGNIQVKNGLQLYILYNSKWCQDFASYGFQEKASTLLYNDRPQSITFYEKYPDGQVTQNYAGYLNKGYHPGWFVADKEGWHQMAVVGSESGWSNILQIFVQ